ncbi:MAG: hypothetical protein ACREUV_01460, partial [Burkholderiales bacterium]
GDKYSVDSATGEFAFSFQSFDKLPSTAFSAELDEASGRTDRNDWFCVFARSHRRRSNLLLKTRLLRVPPRFARG